MGLNKKNEGTLDLTSLVILIIFLSEDQVLDTATLREKFAKAGCRVDTATISKSCKKLKEKGYLISEGRTKKHGDKINNSEVRAANLKYKLNNIEKAEQVIGKSPDEDLGKLGEKLLDQLREKLNEKKTKESSTHYTFKDGTTLDYIKIAILMVMLDTENPEELTDPISIFNKLTNCGLTYNKKSFYRQIKDLHSENLIKESERKSTTNTKFLCGLKETSKVKKMLEELNENDKFKLENLIKTLNNSNKKIKSSKAKNKVAPTEKEEKEQNPITINEIAQKIETIRVETLLPQVGDEMVDVEPIVTKTLKRRQTTSYEFPNNENLNALEVAILIVLKSCNTTNGFYIKTITDKLKDEGLICSKGTVERIINELCIKKYVIAHLGPVISANQKVPDSFNIAEPKKNEILSKLTEIENTDNNILGKLCAEYNDDTEDESQQKKQKKDGAASQKTYAEDKMEIIPPIQTAASSGTVEIILLPDFFNNYREKLQKIGISDYENLFLNQGQRKHKFHPKIIKIKKEQSEALYQLIASILSQENIEKIKSNFSTRSTSTMNKFQMLAYIKHTEFYNQLENIVHDYPQFADDKKYGRFFYHIYAYAILKIIRENEDYKNPPIFISEVNAKISAQNFFDFDINKKENAKYQINPNDNPPIFFSMGTDLGKKAVKFYIQDERYNGIYKPTSKISSVNQMWKEDAGLYQCICKALSLWDTTKLQSDRSGYTYFSIKNIMHYINKQLACFPYDLSIVKQLLYLINNMKEEYNLAEPDSMLDGSHGWGERALAALLSLLKVYYSVDPNPEVIRIWKEKIFPAYKHYNPNCEIENIVACFEDLEIKDEHDEPSKDETSAQEEANLDQKTKPVSSKNIAITRKFALFHTSPPFYDLERYAIGSESQKNQSSERYTLTQWNDEFLPTYVENAVKSLLLNGIFAPHIPGNKTNPQSMANVIQKCINHLNENGYNIKLLIEGLVKTKAKTLGNNEIIPIYVKREVTASIPMPVTIKEKDTENNEASNDKVYTGGLFGNPTRKTTNNETTFSIDLSWLNQVTKKTKRKK